VPVPVKLVCLLAEFLSQKHEAAGAGAEEGYSDDADDDDASHQSLDADDLDALQAAGLNLEVRGWCRAARLLRPWLRRGWPGCGGPAVASR
jgi:hypothetical protein